MELLLYLLMLSVVKVLQALPLPWAARLGRWGGGLAYYLDGRHRRVALTNLRRVYENRMAERERRGLARENFRRLGENYCAAIKTAAMSFDQLRPHLTILGLEKVTDPRLPLTSRVIAVGHFGNFELYARVAHELPQFKGAATYRSLNQPRLNRLLTRLRAASGILLFERRGGMKDLQEALRRHPLCIGFLCDQKAGRSGVRGPFLGHECSTSTAAALFSLRYDFPLFSAVCYRVGLAQWRIEISDQIPTVTADGQRRPVEVVVGEINRLLEEAVRRDPANWFWVHDRWKFSEQSRPSRSARSRSRRRRRPARPARPPQNPGHDTLQS